MTFQTPSKLLFLMGLARSALEFRRQVVQLRQQVVHVLASNIDPRRLTPDAIRQLAETFDCPASTFYADNSRG